MKKIEAWYEGNPIPQTVTVVCLGYGSEEWVEYVYGKSDAGYKDESGYGEMRTDFRGVLKEFCSLSNAPHSGYIKAFVEKFGRVTIGTEIEETDTGTKYREPTRIYRDLATEFRAMMRIIGAISQGKSDTPISAWRELSAIRFPAHESRQTYNYHEVDPKRIEEFSTDPEMAVRVLASIVNDYIEQTEMVAAMKPEGVHLSLSMRWLRSPCLFPLLVNRLAATLIARNVILCAECGVEHEGDGVRQPQARRNWYCTDCKPEATRQANTERKRSQREREATKTQEVTQ